MESSSIGAIPSLRSCANIPTGAKHSGPPIASPCYLLSRCALLITESIKSSPLNPYSHRVPFPSPWQPVSVRIVLAYSQSFKMQPYRLSLVVENIQLGYETEFSIDIRLCDSEWSSTGTFRRSGMFGTQLVVDVCLFSIARRRNMHFLSDRRVGGENFSRGNESSFGTGNLLWSVGCGQGRGKGQKEEDNRY